jgi:hypothetical protein
MLERLADLEHERWSNWMHYLFTKGAQYSYGEFQIEAASVAHWRRQMNTPYSGLTEAEKESDRKEARKTLAVLTDDAQNTKGVRLNPEEVRAQSEALACAARWVGRFLREMDPKEAIRVHALTGALELITEAAKQLRLKTPG